MTKRALIVIAILVLIPVIAVAIISGKFKDKNRVVAVYGENVGIIEYNGMTLRRIDDEFEYKFKLGEYLGKVDDEYTGAPLYRVADDNSGKYFAIAEGGQRTLYTESGKLTDGIKKANSKVTRVIFDNYLAEEKDAEDIEILAAIDGRRVSVDMSSYAEFKYHDLYVSFDGSAIVTEYYGRLIYIVKLDKWVFVLPAETEIAEEKYGEKIGNAVYTAILIENKPLIKLIDSYFKADSEVTK